MTPSVTRVTFVTTKWHLLQIWIFGGVGGSSGGLEERLVQDIEESLGLLGDKGTREDTGVSPNVPNAAPPPWCHSPFGVPRRDKGTNPPGTRPPRPPATAGRGHRGDKAPGVVTEVGDTPGVARPQVSLTPKVPSRLRASVLLTDLTLVRQSVTWRGVRGHLGTAGGGLGTVGDSWGH